MENTSQRSRNGALWAGFLLMLLAVLSNGLFFLGIPGQQVLPWLSLLLSIVALVSVIAGLRRVFGQAARRGRILAVVLSVLSLLLFGFGLLAFVSGRHIPPVVGAPRVGEKVPEFNLSDSDGKPVSFSHLLSEPGNGGVRPKGVLLVFYRGYW
jgi:uncharacterized membrane protein